MIDLMTKGERSELIALAKKRERVAKTSATHRAAQLKADFERQLDTLYWWDQDELWKELVEKAKKVTDEAEAALARDCQLKGIPKECAPHSTFHWHERGRNAFKKEREEMRRVAYTRIDEMEKAAKETIERTSLEIQTELHASGLESSQAKAFLARMPSVDALMPSLEVAEVEKRLLSGSKESRHDFGG